MKKNAKVIIGIVIGLIIGTSTIVGATTIFRSEDITYSSSTNKTNVKDSLDELYNKVGKCPEGQYCFGKAMPLAIINVGDYISMTPTVTSYKIPTSVTGYTSEQTITPSELNIWRVIRKNEDGTVEVVSEYVSSKSVYFYGKAGYMNLVGGLNTIAAQYTNTKYVSKARHIGYNNQTELITDTSALSSVSQPWDHVTCRSWTCPSSNFTELEEKKGAGDVGFTLDYSLVNKAIGTIEVSTPNGNKMNYWLASRYYTLPSGGWAFGGSYVTIGGELGGGPLVEIIGGSIRERGWSLGIRPILTLKSNIEIRGGDGKSAATAYQLK